jgi:hypothetical protein
MSRANITERRNATHKQLSQNKRQAVDKCADCLDKHRPMLDYDSFLSDGLPITSGMMKVPAVI